MCSFSQSREATSSREKSLNGHAAVTSSAANSGELPPRTANAKGVGKALRPPPRFPVKGKGDGKPSADMGEGKGPPFPVKGGGKGLHLRRKGKGKGPPFPVKGGGKGPPFLIKGKGKGLLPLPVKGKGKSKGSTPQSPAVPSGPPRHIVARMMNGRSIDLQIPCDALIRSARFEVARELGIHKARVRLACDGAVLDDVRSIDNCGLAEDAEVSVIILSPLHGNLADAGIKVPDHVLHAKAELHDVLLASARFRQVGEMRFSGGA